LTAIHLRGEALHEILVNQSAFEASLRNPNITVTNVSERRAEFAAGLLPPEADALRAALPFFNRLHSAVRAAERAHSPPAAPPPVLPDRSGVGNASNSRF
jgi:hypothetical protein